jgi:hypothetical protein
MPANPKVDAHIARAPEYARPILRNLRRIVRRAAPRLAEEIKWGAPTYVGRGLVCSFHAFKAYVGFWFHKGALLKDPAHLLQPGATARTMKGIRLASLADIDESGLAALVREAVEVDASGAKPPRRPVEVVVPAALRKALAKQPKARAFFDSLPSSHRREYASHVAEAIRPETVERRVAWTVAELEAGRRPHEKYRAPKRESTRRQTV